MSDILNIAQICPGTHALGPGKRFVIWVQGCPFDCDGCVAPDWIPRRTATLVSAAELARRIVVTDGLEGITLSGGEPMLQAGPLASLVVAARAVRPSLSVIAFSGFTLERLREMATTKPGVAALLEQLDVLIDALYVADQNDGRGLRGSSNQRVHFLTERYRALGNEFESGPRPIEVHLLSGELLLTGVPSPEGLRTFHSMTRGLRRRAI